MAFLDSLAAADPSELTLKSFNLPPAEPKAGISASAYFAGRTPRVMSSTLIEATGRVSERYVVADSLNFMFERNVRPMNGPAQDSGHRLLYVCNGVPAHGEPPDTALNHLAIVAGRVRLLDTLFPPVIAQTARKASDTTIWFDSTAVPEGTHGRAAAVFLAMDGHRFLLDVGFADSVMRVFPKPGIVPNADPHSDDHGEKTYCYTFSGGYLTLLDNGFVANAELRRGSPPATAACPGLSGTPSVNVAGIPLTLESPVSAVSQSAFPGFRPTRDPGSHDIVRDWWSYGRSERSGDVLCLYENVIIGNEVKDGVLVMLGVQTNGESDNAHSKPVRGYPADTIFSCR